jgi:hypothetical protein
MYTLDDPLDEADHVMPWRHIITGALFGAAAFVLLAPIVAVLWLFSPPKDGGEGAPRRPGVA